LTGGVPSQRRLMLFCAGGRADGGCRGRVRHLHGSHRVKFDKAGVRTPRDFLGHLGACELQSSEAFGCLRHGGCGSASAYELRGGPFRAIVFREILCTTTSHGSGRLELKNLPARLKFGKRIGVIRGRGRARSSRPAVRLSPQAKFPSLLTPEARSPQVVFSSTHTECVFARGGLE
jgi:hypothetical protein